MALTRREQQRLDTLAEIKEIARRQMAEVGAGALSLRAIAREMRMTAPALYRYFDSREDLVTELIVEAYTALANAIGEADRAVAGDDFAGRLRAVAEAYRRWALARPEDYTLIYGTPIPGYEAPRERTVAPAARVIQNLGRVLAEAWWAGELQIPDAYTSLPPALRQGAEALLAELPWEEVPAGGVILTMHIWSTLHGLVWGEIHGHFPPGLAPPGELYRLEIRAIATRLGLTSA